MDQPGGHTHCTSADKCTCVHVSVLSFQKVIRQAVRQNDQGRTQQVAQGGTQQARTAGRSSGGCCKPGTNGRAAVSHTSGVPLERTGSCQPLCSHTSVLVDLPFGGRLWNQHRVWQAVVAITAGCPCNSILDVPQT
jgi:hypothetical protein